MQKQTSTSLSLLLSLVLLIVTMGVSPVAAQQEPAESYDELVARQAMTASFTAAVAEGNVDYAKQQLVADMQAFINAHSMDEMQARQYMIDNVIRMGSETTPYEEVSPDMFPAAAAISKSGQDIVTN